MIKDALYLHRQRLIKGFLHFPIVQDMILTLIYTCIECIESVFTSRL